MTIIRVKKTEKYSIISNEILDDPRLSWKATGILIYLLSKPDNWVVHIKQLAKSKLCGVKAVYSGVKELRELGYIEHVFIREDSGKMIRGEYIVHEVPIKIKKAETLDNQQYAQNGHAVNGHAVNGYPLVSTDIKQVLINDDDKTVPAKTQIPAQPKEDPSPSSSNPRQTKPESNQAIITAITAMCVLLPDKFNVPSVNARLMQATRQGHSVDDLERILKWCIETTNATHYKKFLGYLGKSIDNGYAVNPEEDQVVDEQEIMKKRLELPLEWLKIDAEQGNRYSQKALEIIKGKG